MRAIQKKLSICFLLIACSLHQSCDLNKKKNNQEFNNRSETSSAEVKSDSTVDAATSILGENDKVIEFNPFKNLGTTEMMRFQNFLQERVAWSLTFPSSLSGQTFVNLPFGQLNALYKDKTNNIEYFVGATSFLQPILPTLKEAWDPYSWIYLDTKSRSIFDDQYTNKIKIDFSTVEAIALTAGNDITYLNQEKTINTNSKWISDRQIGSKYPVKHAFHRSRFVFIVEYSVSTKYFTNYGRSLQFEKTDISGDYGNGDLKDNFRGFIVIRADKWDVADLKKNGTTDDDFNNIFCKLNKRKSVLNVSFLKPTFWKYLPTVSCGLLENLIK